MQTNYLSEKYHPFIKTSQVSFERMLVYETAFDGIVKIFKIQTTCARINTHISKKFFGEFYYATENGLFLRLFNRKDSWPKATLIYIDTKERTIKEIHVTDSSWLYWPTEDLGNNKYAIKISPDRSIIYQE